MSAEQVATAFVQHYYTTFDQNRAGLANLYQDVSTMSWEGTMLTGQQAIVQKLSLLPQVLHEYPTVDVQPSTSPNAILIFVQGKLKIEDNNPIQFTQVFQLVAHQQGAYYIHNDVFRLQYG
uniref:Nuclear transport factor 2 n=1 Tax=Globisporangium ultimum (strain ATCC 200006 / CBS 805.95 / DAOM BR144) TaxID=431595 RepID=K3WSL4_GLOUD